MLKIEGNFYHDTEGDLEEIYAVLERYNLNLVTSSLKVTLGYYSRPDGFARTHSPYIDKEADSSHSLGLVRYNGEDLDLNLHRTFQWEITEKVDVEEPIYETQTVTETETYYDFDEEGELVEKEQEQTYEKEVQTGTKKVTYSQKTLRKKISQLESWAYTQLQKELLDTFDYIEYIQEEEAL